MGNNILNEAVNGKLSNLTSIGGNHKLNAEAAAAYLKMVAAAKADGVTWSITDSYRPLEIQDKIFDWDYFKKTNIKRKKGTSSIAAAYPGTSNHGWGAAVDLGAKYGDKAHQWLTKNASKFGFTHPFKNPKEEPWHWEHRQSAKNMGANISVPTINGTPQDYTSQIDGMTTDTDDTKQRGDSLLKGILSKSLGIDSLAKSFAGINEEITRIKKLF